VAIYEFVGTFIALVGVNCAQNNAAVAAVGFFIAATLTGRVCGGHFNSAITLAVYITEGKWLKNLPIALLICTIDLLGALAAMMISVAMLGENKIFKLSPPAVADAGADPSVVGILFTESLFTYILVSTVLFVKYRKVSATTDGMLSNLTCALAVFVCVSMAAPITGAGLNPTFGLVLQVTNIIIHKG
jgi:glycerol uptake facilitator-like aquaporin